MTSTAEWVAQWAIVNGGLKGNDAAVATAIALAESGGNPNAVGDFGCSIGVWQINTCAHGTTYGSKDELKNPATNAKAMAALSGGGKNFTPWTTYTIGAYLVFMPTATNAVNTVGANIQKVGSTTFGSGVGIPLPGVKAIADLIKAGDAVGALVLWLTDPDNWLRVAMFGAGGVLVILGVILFALGGKGRTASAARGAASMVLPGPKALLAARQGQRAHATRVVRTEELSHARTRGVERARSEEHDRRFPDRTPPEGADNPQPSRPSRVRKAPRTHRRAVIA